MTEAGGNYSGADLRLRKGDDLIDSVGRQVYVNVNHKHDGVVGAGLPRDEAGPGKSAGRSDGHRGASPLP
ncbi:hypothetical protein, partial [Pseudomonas sp. GZD-209]|uniref:hypothetical protein n=1 Tax=Pseudomonas sp. GZD-209 TaxID=3404807 RepID=UPI003BB64402